MNMRWTIPAAVALLALAAGILLSQGAGQAQVPAADLVVTKSVQPSLIAPGETVIYTVELSNTAGVTLTLSSLVDTLADGFEYVGLAPGSEWGVEPWDRIPPQIQWAGPMTVPISDTLIVRYYVHVPADVPLSPSPYLNTVVATAGGHNYTAQTGLLVVRGEVTVDKSASPDRVKPGEIVTYTVTFNNSGYVPVPMAVVTDLLPANVTFVTMTAHSDLSTPPVGTSGTITWPGPMTIPSHAGFVVEYQAAMPVTSDTLHLQNQAWGQLGDGTVVGPAGAGVVVSTQNPMTVSLPMIYRDWAPPAFAVTKSAYPTVAYAQTPGALITYTVTLINEGTVPGVLADIRDTLPLGFTFVQMLPGSDVTTPPSGTSGQIIWTGPFPVNGRSSLTLRYQVRASSSPGTYTNSATATASQGRPPQAPASATVELKSPALLIEEFDPPSSNWEEFLNNWRLKPEQWHYAAESSDDGSTVLKHVYYLGVANPEDGAHDALIMYKAPGAEQWTDYVFQARAVLFAGDGSGRGKFGMWFRGTGNQVDQPPGRYVTGYYFILQPGPPMVVELWQIRTDEECGDDCDYNYHFSNPILLKKLQGHTDLDPLGLEIKWGEWYWLRVEVQGPRIRCYVDNILVFDYYDNVGTTFTQGTVGFFTYIAGDARFDHVSVVPLE